MTYLTRLTDRQMATIGPTMKVAEKLLPGTGIDISFATPEFTKKARFWVYSYLFIHNLKDLFRIKQVSSTKFTIFRLEQEDAVIEVPPFNKAEEFVLECLLDVTNEAEALRCITESDLSSEAKLLALSEWKRINS